MSRIAIGLFALLASATVAYAQSPLSGPAGVEPAIVTHGEATMRRPPDRAWLTVSIEVRDARSADARQKAADAMTSLQNALKATGLPADAIRTVGFSLMPEMATVNGATQFKGYVVRNEIEVQVDDLDKLPQVIDAANSPKNVLLSVGSPRFDLKARAAAEQDVLRLAVEDALARAQAIATGARQSLGRILHVDEDTSGVVMPGVQEPMMVPTMMKAGVQTPITPGTIEVHAQVTVTVGIR